MRASEGIPGTKTIGFNTFPVCCVGAVDWVRVEDSWPMRCDGFEEEAGFGCCFDGWRAFFELAAEGNESFKESVEQKTLGTRTTYIGMAHLWNLRPASQTARGRCDFQTHRLTGTLIPDAMRKGL